jgi:periplasmic protein TonB
MRSKMLRMSIRLTVLLVAAGSPTFAQSWTSPTISPEVRDKWCRDVSTPHPSPNPYKVGSNELPYCGGHRSDITPPELLTHPDPVYTGSVPGNYDAPVILSVFVGTEGQPLSILLGRAAGYGMDEAAIEEVKKWRWHPATKDGQPVAAQTTVQVRFRIVQPSAKP